MPLPLLAAEALMSFAPSLFGGLFGRADPQAKLREQIMRLLSAQNVGNQTNQLYNQFLGSPAFSQGQIGVANTTNSLTNNLARSLGARGLTGSGIGAISGPLAQSTAGFNLAGLRTAGYNQASDQAMKLIQQQIQGLVGVGASPNYSSELFGAGLANFGPFFQDWLKKMYTPKVGA